MKNEVLEILSLIGVVPVVKIDSAAAALPLAAALSRGGLPCAEITLRTAAAPDAIRAIADAIKCGELTDFTVGAGTVLTADDVRLAADCGASFIVSPGLDEGVVRAAQDAGLPVIPGIGDATGVMRALALGLDTVKFFPAEQSGGVAMLKALSAPFPGVRFMPTGGVSVQNLRSYLALPSVACCGGSFMVPQALIKSGDFVAIETLTRAAVDEMLGFNFKHIGINAADGKEAADAAALLCALFSFPKREIPVSYFTGEGIEIMKAPGRGKMGHIAVGTSSPSRAVFHLTRRGAAFDMSSAKYGSDGKLTFIYLSDEICGFAVHLTVG